METQKTEQQQRECEEYLYNGTRCRRPAITTVPLDFTDERKAVCKMHAPKEAA